MMARKQLWVLAGGNGAGKSTFHERFLAPLGVPFVNADLIALDLNDAHPEKVSYEAARVAERLRYDLIHSGVSFCFETVFSHPSKIDFIAEAKALGYDVIMVFVHLASDELNQARVAQRVSDGGHNVPAEKVISRIPRTLRHVHSVLPLVDMAQFYDNSSSTEPYRSVARLEHGVLTHVADPLPEWAEEMLRGYLSE